MAAGSVVMGEPLPTGLADAMTEPAALYRVRAMSRLERAYVPQAVMTSALMVAVPALATKLK
jgi:hypothetical protein